MLLKVDNRRALLITMFGNSMPRNRDENEEVELPGEGDENVGDGTLVKKREKRRKSKEERAAERRVVFWTLIIILLITFGFWLMPKIGNIFNRGPVIEKENKDQALPAVEKPVNKNYVEISL
jgi:hypothetical protein